MKHFISGSLVAVDTETTGIDVWHGDAPFCVAFCNEEGDTHCFEWPVDPYTRTVIPDQKDIDRIKRFLEDPSVAKVFHNGKYDIRILEQAYGIHTAGEIHDTMIMAKIYNNLEPTAELKPLAKKYIRYGSDDEEGLKTSVKAYRRQAKKYGFMLGYEYHLSSSGEVNEKARVEMDYWLPKVFDPSDNRCSDYCVCDVERTMLLFKFYSKLLKQQGQYKCYEEEMSLFPVVYDMETYGVRVDVDKIEEQTETLRQSMREDINVLCEAYGGSFNPDSTKQAKELFVDKLHLPITKRTEKGNVSVSLDALEDVFDNEYVQRFIRFKTYNKALSTFYLKFKHLSVPEGNIMALHPSVTQVDSRTQRFSFRRPNLQNVSQNENGRNPVSVRVRQAFTTRPGMEWVLFDYSQVELRIAAALAEEKAMLDCFDRGEDVHSMTANKVWGGADNEMMYEAAAHALCLTPLSEAPSEEVLSVLKGLGVMARDVSALRSSPAHCVDVVTLCHQWMSSFEYDIVAAEKSVGKKTSRRNAKAINFGKIYGQGDAGLARVLRCSIDVAHIFNAGYDTAFPRIIAYMRELASEVERNGYITDCFGYRLRVDRDASYKAVNYMVQGSAARLIKRAIKNSVSYLTNTGIDAHFLLTIHDENVYEFNKKHLFKPVILELKRILEDHGGHIPTQTPVEVDIVQDSWDKKRGMKGVN